MTGDKQTQKAGDNSQLLQVGTININGINEKRAREICNETYAIAKRDFTAEAYACANERVQQLENRLIPKIMQLEGAINSFADPAFQLLLTSAQRTAVASERETDYDMLSELLIYHIEKGKSRKTRTGISKAVEIIDKIDNDALCALTVVHAVIQFAPIAPTTKLGIEILANLFEKLMYIDLPSGVDWIEHLDSLNTIRISSFRGFKKIEEYYPDRLDGYSKAGIDLKSENYKKAIELLLSINISSDVLIPNDFLPEYVKLPISSRIGLRDLTIKRPQNIGSQIIYVEKPISEKELDVFESIFDLYTNDKKINKKSETAFMNEWDSHQQLKKLHIWWNSIPFLFELTHIGRILAHTNAKRCDNALPELPLK